MSTENQFSDNPPEPWLVENATVYQLHQVGWRKGEPLMANRQYLQVVGASAEENGALARLIAHLLNIDRGQQ